MNRLYLPVFLLLSGLCASAQTSSTTTISTDPKGARFMVDGQVYSQPVTLNWVAGSKHLVVFLTDPPLPNQTTSSAVQTSVDGSTQYVLTGWKDNAGLLQPTNDSVQTITANPQLTSIIATLQASYR